MLFRSNNVREHTRARRGLLFGREREYKAKACISIIIDSRLILEVQRFKLKIELFSFQGSSACLFQNPIKKATFYPVDFVKLQNSEV
jgi:hypothetical protein